MPVAVALVAPVVGTVVLLLAFALSEVAGHTPVSYPAPRNLAEAAGMGTAAGVLRFLREGQDPNAIVAVGPEVISSSITRVTALEAAMWSRQVELVQLLDRHGAIDGAARRQYLACLGRNLGTDDIVAFLAPDGVADCDADAVRKAIEDRAR